MSNNTNRIMVREAAAQNIRGARITVKERDDGKTTVVELDRNTVILSFAAAAVAGVLAVGGLFFHNMASSDTPSQDEQDEKEKRKYQNAREVD